MTLLIDNDSWVRRDQVALDLLPTVERILARDPRNLNLTVEALVQKCYQYADAFRALRQQEFPTACRTAHCACQCFVDSASVGDRS